MARGVTLRFDLPQTLKLVRDAPGRSRLFAQGLRAEWHLQGMHAFCVNEYQHQNPRAHVFTVWPSHAFTTMAPSSACLCASVGVLPAAPCARACR